MLEAIIEAGVVAPPYSLPIREVAGALRLKVEKALREGVSVVE